MRVAQERRAELLVGHQPANHHLNVALRHVYSGGPCPPVPLRGDPCAPLRLLWALPPGRTSRGPLRPAPVTVGLAPRPPFAGTPAPRPLFFWPLPPGRTSRGPLRPAPFTVGPCPRSHFAGTPAPRSVYFGP